jgi:23S rRNA pseudouridine2605 synthase
LSPSRPGKPAFAPPIPKLRRKITSKNPPRPPAPKAEGERLQKLLAAAGLGSRREIETWIAAGRLSVNGQPAALGMRAGPGDEILLDGKPIQLRAARAVRVLLYHKPVGELVTRADPEGRPTVFSRLPPGRWIAVGRLDLNSSGLLLLTDSGELANRLMHPRYEVVREYLARVQGPVDIEKLRRGVPLDDGDAAFESIDALEREASGANRWYRVSLREGRNREVRRLFAAVGARVGRLRRVRYGPVELPRDLQPGEWRELPAPQVARLAVNAGLQ